MKRSIFWEFVNNLAFVEETTFCEKVDGDEVGLPALRPVFLHVTLDWSV